MVKEYCLIPRNSVPTIPSLPQPTSSTSTTTGGRYRSSRDSLVSVATMVKTKSKVDRGVRKRRRVNNNEHVNNNEQFDTNPSLTRILAISFRDPGERDAAEAILQWLSSQPQVRWDESGNIYSPIIGLSMISYLKYMVQGENDFSGFKLRPCERELVKVLNTIIPIPKPFISQESDATSELYPMSSNIDKLPFMKWIKY